jgi:hypothetical protein
MAAIVVRSPIRRVIQSVEVSVRQSCLQSRQEGNEKAGAGKSLAIGAHGRAAPMIMASQIAQLKGRRCELTIVLGGEIIPAA